MIPPITLQEIEQLSAYLDGQLPIREKMLLELRLRDEPELQAELESLAHTHLLLQSLPKRRAPRNFTLSPEKVRVRAPLRLFPAFGLASALAAVLLVVVFTGDLLLGSAGFRSAATSMPVAMEQSIQVERQAEPTQAAPMIEWGTPENYAAAPLGKGGGGGELEAVAPAPTYAAEMAGIGGGPVETVVVEVTTQVQDLTPPAEVTPTGEHNQAVQQASPTPTPTHGPAGTQADSSVQDTPTPEPTATVTPTATPLPSDIPAPKAVGDAGTGPILGLQPTAQEGQAAATPEPEPTAPSPLRTVEIILGAAAVAAGLAALILYLKEKS
jgi:anti-sigma factor RsiW